MTKKTKKPEFIAWVCGDNPHEGVRELKARTIGDAMLEIDDWLYVAGRDANIYLYKLSDRLRSPFSGDMYIGTKYCRNMYKWGETPVEDCLAYDDGKWSRLKLKREAD